MKASADKPSALECPLCGEEKVMRHLPQEVDRELFYEEITVPAEPKPRVLKVAIIRITHQRDFLCLSCGYQWSKTYITESQKHV